MFDNSETRSCKVKVSQSMPHIYQVKNAFKVQNIYLLVESSANTI
jgi:hypothetical protein